MIIYLKRLKSSKFVRVKAFPMYGGIGVSAPSLHRESTDSLRVYRLSDNVHVWWVISVSAGELYPSSSSAHFVNFFARMLACI